MQFWRIKPCALKKKRKKTGKRTRKRKKKSGEDL